MQFDRTPIGLRHRCGLDFGWRPAFERASEQRRDVIPVPRVNAWQSLLEDFNRRRDDIGEARHVAAPFGSLTGEERLVIGDPRRLVRVVPVREHLEHQNARGVSRRHARRIDGGEEETRPQRELHRLALRSSAQDGTLGGRGAPSQPDHAGDVTASFVRLKLVDDNQSAIGLDHLPDAGLAAMPVRG
jgi:hypothetical protein